jgi:hypothetical protein
MTSRDALAGAAFLRDQCGNVPKQYYASLQKRGAQRENQIYGFITELSSIFETETGRQPRRQSLKGVGRGSFALFVKAALEPVGEEKRWFEGKFTDYIRRAIESRGGRDFAERFLLTQLKSGPVSEQTLRRRAKSEMTANGYTKRYINEFLDEAAFRLLVFCRKNAQKKMMWSLPRFGIDTFRV